MRNKLPKSERDGVMKSFPMQIKALSASPRQYRKLGSSRATSLLRELSQDRWGPRPSTAGARVYTRDALAQPVCQGAQTQDALVVAKVTTQIWFDLIWFDFFLPLNNIAE